MAIATQMSVKDGVLRTDNPAIKIPLSAIFEETSE
jgi:hypothetical protein